MTLLTLEIVLSSAFSPSKTRKKEFLPKLKVCQSIWTPSWRSKRRQTRSKSLTKSESWSISYALHLISQLSQRLIRTETTTSVDLRPSRNLTKSTLLCRGRSLQNRKAQKVHYLATLQIGKDQLRVGRTFHSKPWLKRESRRKFKRCNTLSSTLIQIDSLEPSHREVGALAI